MSGHGLLERMLGDQLIVNGMLIVIAVSTLTFAYRHLRHVRGQRPSAHSRARRAPDTGRIPSPANPPGAAGRRRPLVPAATPGSSWPGRPGRRRCPAPRRRRGPPGPPPGRRPVPARTPRTIRAGPAGRVRERLHRRVSPSRPRQQHGSGAGTRARSRWPPGFVAEANAHGDRDTARGPRPGGRVAGGCEERRPLTCCGRPPTGPRRSSPPSSPRPPRSRRPS